jgi:uncharacterized protein YyaL (SSP411 family)
MGAPSDEDDFEFPDWHLAYHAAVVETDPFKVLELVQAAENAISKRLERITARSGHEVQELAEELLRALEPTRKAALATASCALESA